MTSDMKNKTLILVLLTIFTLSHFSTNAQAFSFIAEDTNTKKSVPREVLLSLKEKAVFELMETGLPFVRSENATLNNHIKSQFIETIEPIFLDRFEAVKKLHLINVSLGKTNSLKELELQVINEKRAIMNLKALDRTPDSIATLSNAFRIKLKPFTVHNEKTFVKALKVYNQIEFAEENFLMRSTVGSTDPFYSQQWGLKNTGQTHNGTAGLVGADINIED